jgi:hypothetical protein
MSHFSVIVALPGGTDLTKVDTVLADVLEPWNENKDVEPYRKYEEGGPQDFWWVEGRRRDAENLKNGTGIKPYNPEMFASFSTAESRETPEQQRAKIAEGAKWCERIGEHPTWEHVIALYKECFGEDDSECPLYDPETGRAYQMSTYNPESKWDYWGVGGRAGGKFIAKPGASVIEPARRWDSPERIDEPLRCDGGAIKDLDLQAMRNAAEVDAFGRYWAWEELSAQYPAAKPWSHFCDLAKDGFMTWDEARSEYRTQPLVKAADKAHERLGIGMGCPIEEFSSPREEYVAEASRAAVPGYALVTLKRGWVAPGQMGWFGMSSESRDEYSAYRTAVNQYIDSLDESTVLVAVDCHI